jgi:hypothetical protein
MHKTSNVFFVYFVGQYQCSRSEIINYGSRSSNRKSKILDPDLDPENHPITDPDPTIEHRLKKKR